MSMKKYEPQAVEIVNTTNDLDIVVSTAKAYPRNITYALDEIKTMINPNVAKTLWYSLPRKDKIIEGPSIRLAELFQTAWGNLRVQSRIKEITNTQVVAECVAYDMEKNVMVGTEVRKRIVDKYGNRYSEDMIIMTANAAISVARRNAIFSIIPKVFVDDILNYAKNILHTHPSMKEFPLKSRWNQLIEEFKLNFKMDKKAVMEKLNIKDENSITEVDYNNALGLFNSMNELLDEVEASEQQK